MDAIEHPQEIKHNRKWVKIARSQSKASYLAYRREPREREKGLPNFEGSYKRTMSPSGRVKSPLVENNQVTVPAPTTTPAPAPTPVVTSSPPPSEPPSPPVPTSPPSPSPAAPLPPHATSQTECPRAATDLPQSKTLPRNYVREAHHAEKQRISRTPRTQSDPLNMPGRLAELSGAVETHQSQHLSLAMVKRERIPRSRSDISNAGSNESGYSSSSLNVSSPASSPTRTPVDLSERGIEPGDPPNYRTQCVETQCNLGVRPPLQCTSQSYKPVHRPIPLSRLGSCSVSDASSQTDLTSSGPASLSPPPPPDPLSPLSRQLEEEIECDKLSRDLASVLPPNDRLHGILVPGPDVKKRRDYVTSLFRIDVTPRSKSSSSSSHSSDPASPKETKNGLSEGSAYFAPSECKAKLLALASHQARQTDHVNSRPTITQSSTSNNSTNSLSNLHQKKAELMSRLDSKLTLLRSVQVDLNEESRGNDRLGEALATRLASEARPAETAKYKLHVQEVGHITSLLLGLSGRLARAENALIGLREDHCDRKSLEEKRDKLASQLEEAKELKENIDRRSTNVATLLRKYLSSEEFADYNHFINMKAKLLVDAREISDKIQLGEEQLAALQETMEGES
ncbi:hypothetical protein M8J77_020867 [Diaphorina citri]|nr:hypothetical protein M8J77_020867 [Diaphorina citri]